VLATVERDTFTACEEVAEDAYGSNDYAWTTSPALDFDGGLIANADAPEL